MRKVIVQVETFVERANPQRSEFNYVVSKVIPCTGGMS